MAAARRPRVTSTDVARASGFSRQLVGFVLNNTPGQSIPETTRAKVLRAAEELGYVPHGPAQALRRGRGRTVLLAIPDLPQGGTMGDMLEVLADELATEGFTLVTYLLGAEHRSPKDVAAALAPVAVVGMVPFTESEIATFTASGAALVLPQPGTRFGSNLEEVMQLLGEMQVDYLSGRGHRRIAFAVPGDIRSASLSAGRYEGARRAAERRGLPPVKRYVVPSEGAADVVRVWRSGRHPITAVACHGDEVAFAVLAAARAAGLRVPEDLAVMGADELSIARYAEPPLTTISIDGRSSGVILARTLVDLLADRTPPPFDLHDGITLVPRASA
ncbi:LacI family DNA-binding transcriptional regulator [Cryptosporangium aurantiacum]|uniref:Transcriptional regulator, LacI family n=1 Tax=Cryptosporangium aurantiacum TaxID=134849 RepID=A0A1M7KMB2_9ACTN|nr:LacI family DNA-binding transcriptional regulator [Cryptosporangium aurantiacum]SHM66563.1 transcriptional regulator, LacI family [Cryptosporangium aurantiacum]